MFSVQSDPLINDRVNGCLIERAMESMWNVRKLGGKMGHYKVWVSEFLLSLIQVEKARTFLDLGCGKGADLIGIARIASPDSSLVGLDFSENSIQVATISASTDDRIRFLRHDMETGLPFDDNTFDVVISCNVLECIQHKELWMKELSRVLRPGGQVVMAHYDWDTQIFNAVDKSLFRHVIQTYNDWQQPWMNACDAWMGRRLNGLFQTSGLFSGAVIPYVHVETAYEEGQRGYSLVHEELVSLVEHAILGADDFSRFEKELADLAANGEYFYSINLYAYVGNSTKSA